MSISIEEVANQTAEIIEAFCSDARAKQLNKFIENIGTEVYFSAPASSKKEYHGCYPGGLAKHNLNVVNALFSIVEACELGIDTESICVAGLLHDIGKTINTDLKPYYVPETENWKKERGEMYSRNEGSIFLPTHQRSIWLIHRFEFCLSPDEYQAILLNDGQYLAENKVYANRECELAKLVHMADNIALIKEKREETKKK